MFLCLLRCVSVCVCFTFLVFIAYYAPLPSDVINDDDDDDDDDGHEYS